jgi:hypothetical protein
VVGLSFERTLVGLKVNLEEIHLVFRFTFSITVLQSCVCSSIKLGFKLEDW